MSERTTQVLSLHKITPRCYDLTSVRTGSIRDQIIRATLLADALHEAALVDAGKDLLVLGAGAAGVALALAAAARGVHVTIVEKQRNPLWTLQSCNWRTVDPTEYDWPHPHWNNGKLPLVTRSAPLTGRVPAVQLDLKLPPSRMDGTSLASVWTRLYGSIFFPTVSGSATTFGSGSVAFLYNKDANDLTIDDSAAAAALARRAPTPKRLPMSSPAAAAASPLTRATAHWPEWPSPMQFGAVVACIGFGDEITAERPALGGAPTWSGFSGHRFWFDDDRMLRRGFAPSASGAKPSAILVSGSGDGAMQDFQRAATGLFGRDLYEEIKKHVPFAPEGVMREALLAEDYARRDHGWRPNGFRIDEALKAWNLAYGQAAFEVWTGWKPATSQIALAGHILRPELQAYLQNNGGGLRLQWIMREMFPGYAYGLNRFLCLLVWHMAKALDSRPAGSPPLVLTEHEIAGIRPTKGAAHTCGTPAGCYAERHDVDLLPVGSGAGGSVIHQTFDLILVRHGQEPAPLFGGAAVPEQQVPFDLPH